MGIGTLVVIVVVAVFATGAAFAVRWWRRAFKRAADDQAPAVASDEVALRAAIRLTSTALRALPTPVWRVVYEIGNERLTGAAHVVIGPPGAFAVTTSLDPLPDDTSDGTSGDPVALAAAAMTRGGLDDALRRVRQHSAGLVVVHWGGAATGAPVAVAGVHGVTHVDGRRLTEWAAALDGQALAPTQVDQAWQAVVTGIGRPDPL